MLVRRRSELRRDTRSRSIACREQWSRGERQRPWRASS